MNSTNIRNKLFVSMILGIVVFGGLLAYGDFTSVGSHVREFRWELMPLILAVTLGNYGLRFLKWQYYLKQIQVGQTLHVSLPSLPPGCPSVRRHRGPTRIHRPACTARR